MGEDRVDELKRQIADLKKRLPAHSVPAALMEQLDELEEALKRELKENDITGGSKGSDAQPIYFRAIGYVENAIDFPTAKKEIQSFESRLIIDPTLTEGLRGLEPGQQIMVVFYFHLSEGFNLLQHPRGDPSRPRRGVFSLRSCDRPNAIGVTVVDLIGIDRNVLHVRGLDAVNGTPLLDLKPV